MRVISAKKEHTPAKLTVTDREHITRMALREYQELRELEKKREQLREQVKTLNAEFRGMAQIISDKKQKVDAVMLKAFEGVEQ